MHAFISTSGITPVVSGNSLAVIGEDAVLVVDTGQFPSLARVEIAEIQRLTALPVRYELNVIFRSGRRYTSKDVPELTSRNGGGL